MSVTSAFRSVGRSLPLCLCLLLGPAALAEAQFRASQTLPVPGTPVRTWPPPETSTPTESWTWPSAPTRTRATTS